MTTFRTATPPTINLPTNPRIPRNGTEFGSQKLERFLLSTKQLNKHFLFLICDHMENKMRVTAAENVSANLCKK